MHRHFWIKIYLDQKLPKANLRQNGGSSEAWSHFADSIVKIDFLFYPI